MTCEINRANKWRDGAACECVTYKWVSARADDCHVSAHYSYALNEWPWSASQDACFANACNIVMRFTRKWRVHTAHFTARIGALRNGSATSIRAHRLCCLRVSTVSPASDGKRDVDSSGGAHGGWNVEKWRRPQRKWGAPEAAAVRAVDEQQRDVAQAAAARECLAVGVAEWPAARYARRHAPLDASTRGARSRWR